MAKQSALAARFAFPPNEVKLNRDTGLLKLIAMAAMLIDHLGATLFPQYFILRIIGRLAFPIYAYCIAVGAVYSHDKWKYLQRLLLIALISQPIYAMAMNHGNRLMTSISFFEKPLEACWVFFRYSWDYSNILVVLALGLMAIWAVQERKWIVAVAIVFFSMLMQSNLSASYGWKGVVLMLLFYLFINRWYLSLPAVAVFMFWWGLEGSRYALFGVGFGAQMFALMALPLIYIPMNTKLKAPKWLFYLFYPAHLGLIWALKAYWPQITAFFSRF